MKRTAKQMLNRGYVVDKYYTQKSKVPKNLRRKVVRTTSGTIGDLGNQRKTVYVTFLKEPKSWFDEIFTGFSVTHKKKNVPKIVGRYAERLSKRYPKDINTQARKFSQYLSKVNKRSR